MDRPGEVCVQRRKRWKKNNQKVRVVGAGERVNTEEAHDRANTVRRLTEQIKIFSKLQVMGIQYELDSSADVRPQRNMLLCYKCT